MTKKLLTAALICILSVAGVVAAERNLLTNAISKEELARTLSKDTAWAFFPTYTDRAKWETLPDDIRNAFIERGEKSLDYRWEIVPASSYLEFIRSGDRSVMLDPENRRIANIMNLALAELAEGKGRFVDALIDGVWAMCEQSTWVHSAHLPSQKGGAGLPNPDDVIIDLGSARIGALMSWLHYFFKDTFDGVSPHISERIRREVGCRVLTPYYTRDNFWWMGFNGGSVNNWNTFCNYYVLTSILLMEKNPELRVENTWKVMRSLDAFVNSYPADGGCDEGPHYWFLAGGKLFESLELLNAASGGAVNIYGDDLIRNIGRYVYRSYIGDNYVTNFSDAFAMGSFEPGVIFRYGRAIDDGTMKSFAAYIMKNRELNDRAKDETMEATLHNVFNLSEMRSIIAAEPLVGECWLPDAQFAVGRDKAGARDGFYFAAKGGHNGESHNHNDAGSFILYYNCWPVLVDVGVGTYTRQTFSSERYTIWNMRSPYHNLPVINGQEQRAGRKFTTANSAFVSKGPRVEFTVDIASAYPEEASCVSWERKYKLERGKKFSIYDTWTLAENKGGNSLNFMVAAHPEIIDSDKGIIAIKGADFTLRLKYDPRIFSPSVEEIRLDDMRHTAAWGESLWRLVLTYKNTGLRGDSIVEISE